MGYSRVTKREFGKKQRRQDSRGGGTAGAAGQ
jgi:hypothetical protein